MFAAVSDALQRVDVHHVDPYGPPTHGPTILANGLGCAAPTTASYTKAGNPGKTPTVRGISNLHDHETG